jgi:hypothetical protein
MTVAIRGKAGREARLAFKRAEAEGVGQGDPWDGSLLAASRFEPNHLAGMPEERGGVEDADFLFGRHADGLTVLEHRAVFEQVVPSIRLGFDLPSAPEAGVV